MDPEAMTPHGLALLAYFEGQTSAEEKFTGMTVSRTQSP